MQKIDRIRVTLYDLCGTITSEATDSRLTQEEVLICVKLLNSAAKIGLKLETRLDRDGLRDLQTDIFRFSNLVTMGMIKIRAAVDRRNEAALEDFIDSCGFESDEDEDEG